MLQMQKDNEQDRDSDIEEGFFLVKPQIKQKIVQLTDNKQKIRPKDYQTRYISSHGVIRKQLPQLLNSFPLFPKEDHPSVESISKKKIKEHLHRQDHLINSKNYRLVYQKCNKKFQFQQPFNQNSLNLQSIVAYSADNYSIVKPWQPLKGNGDDLQFQSRFEAGNLSLAFRSTIQPNSYVLFIENDTNTLGYNKWFNFAVSNAKKNKNYSFYIVNFRKDFDFFRQGLKPTFFSVKQHELTSNGWSKRGKNINFIRSKIHLSQEDQQKSHFTLTFDLSFQYQNDTCCISLLPPYSYSRLSNFLLKCQQSCRVRKDISFQLLTVTYTLANTQVPYLTISSPVKSSKNIVIFARQHPGEVWSSFLVEALIHQLVKEEKGDRQWLLQNYTFRIFPMINIDGVTYGNFRCDLAGLDMNRYWRNSNKLLHPQISAIIEQIKKIAQNQQIVCCLDLHAHSKDLGIFAYCSKQDYQGRLFPLLLSKASPLFHFPSCTYGVSNYKRNTARAIMNQITKSSNILTIEASFYATSELLLHPASFIDFAASVVTSLKRYYSKSKQFLQAKEKLPQIISELPSLKSSKNKSASDQSGSDSEPQCDQITIQEKLGKIIPKCPIVQMSFLVTKTKMRDKSQTQQKNQQSLLPKKLKRKKPKIQPYMRQTVRQKIEFLQEQKIQKPQVITIKNQDERKKSILEKLLQSKLRYSSQVQKQRFTQVLDLKPKNHKQKEKNQSIELSYPQTIDNRRLQALKSANLDTSKYQMKYFVERKAQIQQEFPLLCVLSNNKKQIQLERIKKAPLSQRQTAVRGFQPTLVISKRLDKMQQLRERQKNSSDLVASLWRYEASFNTINHPFVRK